MNNDIDMGSMTSKEIGDLMFKTLIERERKVVNKLYPNMDYGYLSSKILTELGKEALSSDNN